MENIDQTIPFAVLVAIGLLLLFLLRSASNVAASDELLPSPSGRGARGEGPDLSPTPEAGPVTMPFTVEAPRAERVSDGPAETVAHASGSCLSAGTPNQDAKPTKKRLAKPAPAALEPTPLDTVVGLLQQKDTLAAAFLLREIFDAPVSRRRGKSV